MRTFEYKGFTTAGQSRRGLIEALDPKDAREKLAAQGVLAERVSIAGETGSRQYGWKTNFNLETRAMIYRELSALLRAGLPLERALETLLESPELGQNRSRIAGILDQIREGGSFADALKDAGRGVTPFEQAVVQVGERAATLEIILERLADFLEEQERLHDKVQTALIYPLIILGVAVAIAVMMFGVMIPRIAALLAETNMELPALTRGVMAFSHWVMPVLLFLLVAGAGIGIFYRHKADGQGIVLSQRILLRLPFVRRAYTALVSLRFARTLAVLLEGGVSLVEGILLSGKATGNTGIAIQTEHAAELIQQGESLANAIRTVDGLNASLAGWIQAGETGGRLASLLENAADRYQQQWDKSVARGLSLLEPLLILGVGGLVFVIALAILLPVMSLNNALM